MEKDYQQLIQAYMGKKFMFHSSSKRTYVFGMELMIVEITGNFSIKKNDPEIIIVSNFKFNAVPVEFQHMDNVPLCRNIDLSEVIWSQK